MKARPLMVSRVIVLAAPPAADLARLAGTAGIAEAEVTERRLRVVYDLRQCRIDNLLRLLAEAGAPAADGLVHRLRRKWARFSEANLLDQADLVHQCCSSPK